MTDANPKLSDTVRYIWLTISAEVKCKYIESIASWLSVRDTFMLEPESLVNIYMSAFCLCIMI